MRAYEILNEMVVRYRAKHGDWVIAFQDSIWVTAAEIPAKIAKDIAARTGLPLRDVKEGANYMAQITEERPDILVGTIYGGMLSVDGVVSMNIHPGSSLLIKKVVAALGLGGVLANRSSGDDEWEDEFTPEALHGKIPEVVYHGTNSKYLYPILRQGIAPTENANWHGYNFTDRVFFTANLREAMFQANQQAQRHHTIPIVIGTKIPDPSKITLDFDVAVSAYGVNHPKMDPRYRPHAYGSDASKVQAKSPKTDFTREIGTFAYKGRVPSSFFVEMWVPGDEDSPLNQDAQKVERPDFMKAAEMLEEMGFYHPGFDMENGWEDDKDDSWEE